MNDLTHNIFYKDKSSITVYCKYERIWYIITTHPHFNFGARKTSQKTSDACRKSDTLVDEMEKTSKVDPNNNNTHSYHEVFHPTV